MKASCHGVAAASLEGTDIVAGERPAANTRVGVTAPRAPDIGNGSQKLFSSRLLSPFPLYPPFSATPRQPLQSQPPQIISPLPQNQSICTIRNKNIFTTSPLF